MNILYATRSSLPSKAANSVQSAHMAVALDRVFPGLKVVFRGDPMRQSKSAHYTAYHLPTPVGLHYLPNFPFDDLLHVYLLAFARLLRRTEADTLVFTRSTRMAWVSSIVGRSYLLELHDPLIRIRIRFLRGELERGRLAGLVVTTERLKADVVAMIGIPPERVLVAGGAACASYLDLPAIPLRSDSGAQVGYAGSAMKGKGVEVLLRCAALMPEVTFHLIGPSVLECERLGKLSANVRLHGFRSNHSVLGMLKSMDALLLPNQPSVIIRSGADIGQHTSPLKLYEYMAAGRPIIASDLPVFDGILRNGLNCLKVDSAEPKAFCAAIRRLREDVKLGQGLGLQAQSDFRANYTWDHRVARIISFAREVGLVDSLGEASQ